MTHFGTTPDGEPVQRLSIAAGDLDVAVLTYGAILHTVRLAGVDHNLSVGADDLAPYLDAMRYHGAVIGPVANRIGTARATLDGMTYELERNQDGRIHLHSGSRGTQARVWDVADHDPDHLTLICDLGDGDCGLPGQRRLSVTYRILPPATLAVKISATTDQTTLMNPASHPYWRLSGAPTWAGHKLRIAADHYLPVTTDSLPTGDIAPVDGTPYDLRDGPALTPGVPPLDHNFCVSDAPQPLRDVAWLSGPSGLTLTMATNQPGVQIFDGRDRDYQALAIEAQHWPDAPDNRAFPSIRITPDAPYHQETHWTFSRK